MCSAASFSQSVVGPTAANLQTAAPQFGSSCELSSRLPLASDIGLADMLLPVTAVCNDPR